MAFVALLGNYGGSNASLPTYLRMYTNLSNLVAIDVKRLHSFCMYNMGTFLEFFHTNAGINRYTHHQPCQ